MHDKNNKECKLGLIGYEPYKTHYVNSIAPTHQVILPCTCPQNLQQTIPVCIQEDKVDNK